MSYMETLGASPTLLAKGELPSQAAAVYMLTKYLADKEEARAQVTTDDVIAWYMETVEEDIQHEEQLMEQERLVHTILDSMTSRANYALSLSTEEAS